jgi:hypothetical protein
MGNLEIRYEDSQAEMLKKFNSALSDHYLDLGYFYGFINLANDGIEAKYNSLKNKIGDVVRNIPVEKSDLFGGKTPK